MPSGNGSAYYRTGTAEDLLYRLGVGQLSAYLTPYAHYYFRGTTDRREATTMRECIAFVEGTGLRVALQGFGFAVDAEAFRDTFLMWCAWQKRHRSSA